MQNKTGKSLRKRVHAKIFFVLGLVFLLSGFAFFLKNQSDVSGLPIFISVLSICIGVLLSILAIKLHKRSSYLFFSSFFIMFGGFFLLVSLHFVPITFSQGWPILSIFAGLSLIPAGWHRYQGVRVNYIVCTLFFIALGLFLLFFSFKLLPVSFRTFLLEWWPLFILLCGLVLLLLSISSKKE